MMAVALDKKAASLAQAARRVATCVADKDALSLAVQRVETYGSYRSGEDIDTLIHARARLEILPRNLDEARRALREVQEEAKRDVAEARVFVLKAADGLFSESAERILHSTISLEKLREDPQRNEDQAGWAAEKDPRWKAFEKCEHALSLRNIETGAALFAAVKAAARMLDLLALPGSKPDYADFVKAIETGEAEGRKLWDEAHAKADLEPATAEA